jgi:hypothetical protein
MANNGGRTWLHKGEKPVQATALIQALWGK